MRVLGVDPGLTRCGWGGRRRPGGDPLARRRRCCARWPTLDLGDRLLELDTAVTAAGARTGRTSWPSSGCSARTTSAPSWAPRRPPRWRAGRRAGRPPGRAAHAQRGQGGRHRQRPRGQGAGRPHGHPRARGSARRPNRRTPRRARAGDLPRLARAGAGGCAAPADRRPAPIARAGRGGQPMIAFVRGRVAAGSRRRSRRGRWRRPRRSVHARHGRPPAGRGDARLSTSLVVREDSLTLYGFPDEDEQTSCSSSCRRPTA